MNDEMIITEGDVAELSLGASAPNVLLACERPRCEYVVFGAPDDETAAAQAAALMEGHLYQHDNPEEWKAEATSPNPEDEG